MEWVTIKREAVDCDLIKQESVECDLVVKCEFVKEEKGLEQHEWSSACARVEEAGEQTECGVSAAAARAGLYAGCEVKGELVLGPTALQPPDAPSAPPPPVSWQPRLRACSVRLVRLPPDVHTNSAILSTSAKRRTNHDIKPQDPPASHLHSCDACGEQFARKWSFNGHIRLHSCDSHVQAPAQSVPNGVSDERRSAPAALATGARDRAGGKPHQCPLYTKRFLSKSHLVIHERIQTGEKPYNCDICLKQFTQQSNLDRHVRSHTGKKGYYKCDICQKLFTQNCHLVDHLRIHTGEKSYKCDFCQKLFTQKRTLISHVKIHTGKKPHKCDICQKLFRHKSHLVNHIRIHTGEKPFEYDMCLKQFRHKGSLVYHLNNVEGIFVSSLSVLSK